MQSILWNTIFKEIKFWFRLRQGKQNIYLLFVEMKFWKTLIEFELMKSWRFENVVQSVPHVKKLPLLHYVRIKKKIIGLNSWFQNQSHFDWMKWWCRVSTNGNGWNRFQVKTKIQENNIEPIIHETDYKVPAATKTSTLHFC